MNATRPTRPTQEAAKVVPSEPAAGPSPANRDLDELFARLRPQVGYVDVRATMRRLRG